MMQNRMGKENSCSGKCNSLQKVTAGVEANHLVKPKGNLVDLFRQFGKGMARASGKLLIRF